MGKLRVYNFVSVNGYFKGPNEDISWAKQNASDEENEFAAENLQSGSILMFGRVTYEMMASFWPTPEAKKNFAEVAEGMNKAEKIVFSKTLKKADWNNTRIIKGNMEEEVKKLKGAEKDITILGSGSIVNQLAEKGLIDEFQVMVHPVAIGGGTPFLNDISRKLDFELTKTKSFKSGIVFLCYQPKEQKVTHANKKQEAMAH